MSELPEPLTNASHDVSGLDGFMLNTDKLMASELVALATGEEFKAAVCLWCRAWKQVPAGSLPNEPKVLAAFSGAGPRWAKVKDVALRGFILCSDGRLYHKTLCEDVHRAAASKALRRERTKAATEARKKLRDDQRDVDDDDERDVEQSGNVTTSHRQDRTVNKKEEKDKLTLIPKSRGSRLPDDFHPDETCEKLAREKKFTQSQWDTCLAEFRDYWKGVAGAKGVKTDWQATFRNQIRRFSEMKGSKNGQFKQPHIKGKTELIFEALAGRDGESDPNVRES